MIRITLAQLFEHAISWEHEARAMYLALAEAFVEHPAVRALWVQMANDEAVHAALLRKARDATPAERLAEVLGPLESIRVASVETELVAARGAELRSLDDAYELAHRLESSEIVTVFGLLVFGTFDDRSRDALLTNQVDEHLGRLARFAETYPRLVRTGIVLKTSPTWVQP